MRKYLLIAAVAALPLLSACGGKEKNAAGSDTTAAPVDTVAADSTAAAYFLTPDSLGPVKVGMSLNDIPGQVAGLYDTQLPSETVDAMAVTLVKGTGSVATLYDFGEGKIDVIVLENDAAGVNTPNGPVKMGDPFEKVLALPGVKSEWEGFDAEGVWYWNWNGIWFGIDESKASQKAIDELANSNRPPRAADIEKLPVGYIGTGLPF